MADETVYSKKDLMAGAKGFGVTPEVVAGALALAGKNSMTRAEAQEAIAAFLARRV